MRFKKFLAVVIVIFTLMISLVGCDALKKDNNNNDDNQQNNSENNHITLSDIYTWIDGLEVEDIVNVRCEKGAIGVAPTVQPTVAYSTSSVDIQRTYALLSCELELLENYEDVDGGNYIKYTFYTSDGETYSISISNSVVYFNGENYSVKSFYYQFQYPQSDDVDVA